VKTKTTTLTPIERRAAELMAALALASEAAERLADELEEAGPVPDQFGIDDLHGARGYFAALPHLLKARDVGGYVHGHVNDAAARLRALAEAAWDEALGAIERDGPEPDAEPDAVAGGAG
jgi:hypothetical protein